MTLSLQDTYAPAGWCFGCGPANAQGLQVKSFVHTHGLIAHWTPEPHHRAFAGILMGGICGTLLDCHSNWTAAHHFMQAMQLTAPPTCVTSEFHVKLLAPTPMDGQVTLRAQVHEVTGRRAIVTSSISVNDHITCTCTGTFVRVKEDHPAYGKW